MKRLAFVTMVGFAVCALVISAFAQTATSPWAFFVEISSGAEAPGLYDVTVPLEVMDKSRQDLADLRLYDARGKEVPYAVRIRSEVDDRLVIGGSLFNQAKIGLTASEASVDLGEDRGEHNEVEIETAGTNFRRRVAVEGGDTGTDWKTLQTGALIFGFESQNKTVQSDRVSYPTSRYRYLRVKVFADELTDKEPPTITNVSAVKAVRAKGELTTWDANVPAYQLLRNQGAPSSAWNIDLGARVPCDRLILDVDDPSFSRAFQIEAGEDPQSLRLVASGELTRRIGERAPLVIHFDQEENVRKLRLLIRDYSNQTLTITAIKGGAPARQAVFELKEVPAQPLRLFFGNPNATAPHYDFEKELPTRLSITPVRIGVGPAANNPDYKPEPLPLTERVPWLIYIVLTLSSIALGLILFSLARSTIRIGYRAENRGAPPSDS
ncbi:MAG TPA: DUF3999 family protein [Pyrinomonadaceae bacterium]|nr:DUF3999 family protein [Pyrinomonadaceae bacterium]